MARMPQIPQPEFTGRPGGRLSGSEGPQTDVSAVEAPFESGARLAEGVGDRLERLQAEQDAAQAKLQKTVDGITATRMAGDHSEKSRDLLAQLQQQFVDTPDKLPEEYRRQLREMTDGEVKAAPNGNVALDIAQKYAVLDNQQATAAHSWTILRMAQKAKSDVSALINSNVRSAQAQTTLAGLSSSIAGALTTLNPHLDAVHADPDAARTKLKHDMASAWVEANSPLNPAGVSIALDQKKGPLVENLTGDERVRYQKRAAEDLKGYGEAQRFQVIKEAIDHSGKSYDLFLSGDLDSKNVFQMKDSLEKKQTAIAANPNLTAEEKVEQNKVVDLQLKTLRYLDEAARKPGRFDPNFDQARMTKLYDEFMQLGKPGDKKPKDLLKIVQIRHDLAEAQADRAVSDGRAQTMHKALLQMTGSALSREGKNTGWPISFLGFGGRSPQQAGNVVLNSYFKDNKAFGELSDAQKNDARMSYLGQLVDAQEAGRNIDSKAAEQMAFESLKYVSGRAHHPVGGR